MIRNLLPPAAPTSIVSVLAACLLVAPLGAQATPPGLKLVKGGRTTIGTDVKEVQALAASSGKNWENKEMFVGEIPEHKVQVDDFYLGVTEVTVEQYATFLRATGHRPPIDFAKDAVNEAIRLFNQEQGRLAQEAKLAGETFRRRKFDPDKWWEENWQDAEWSVPENQAKTPVVNVNFEDVRAYCQWAGVRPMTEFEFQRAARGNGDDPYPWGDEWDAAKAADIKAGRSEPFEVGSFPDGATEGIHDLIGNVWEWTGSPYVAYPKYKAPKLKQGKGKSAIEKTVTAPFDAAKRVLVGGSIGIPADVMRSTVRQRASFDQSANQLGFRIALSREAGADLARRAWDYEVKQSVLGEASLLLSQGTVLQRWTSEPGTVELDGYSVITGYDALLFVPVEDLHKKASPGEIRKWTEENGPAMLGLLHSTVALEQPAVGPGNYFLAWRGRGELEIEEPEPTPDPDGEKGKATSAQEEDDPIGGLPAWAQVPGFDEDEDQYFVFSAKGEPLLAFGADEPKKERLKAGVRSVMNHLPWQPPKEVDEDAPPPVPMDQVTLRAVVPSGRGTNGFAFRVILKLQPDVVTKDWQ